MPRALRESYEFGGFRLDVAERRLTCPCCPGAHANALPEKAFRTLVHLVRHRGALVTHDELLAEVWPRTVVEKNNVGKAIHAIRTCLGDNGREPRFVQSVPKHGYRFIAEVTAEMPEVRTPSRTGSPAYDLYMRAKVKSLGETLVGTHEAIDLLERALAHDPDSPAAWAQLARACNTRAFKFSPADEATVWQERADVALAKALDLDPGLAEAHFARGLILWTQVKDSPTSTQSRPLYARLS